MDKLCCTPVAPCRRCTLWDESSAHVPVTDLRRCALCEELWADLAPGTGLCPACRVEILERQDVEERAVPELADDVEASRRRAEERRRAEFEIARRQLRRMEAMGFTRQRGRR